MDPFEIRIKRDWGICVFVGWALVPCGVGLLVGIEFLVAEEDDTSFCEEESSGNRKRRRGDAYKSENEGSVGNCHVPCTLRIRAPRPCHLHLGVENNDCSCIYGLWGHCDRGRGSRVLRVERVGSLYCWCSLNRRRKREIVFLLEFKTHKSGTNVVPGEGGKHHRHDNLCSSPAPNDKYPHTQPVSSKSDEDDA